MQIEKLKKRERKTQKQNEKNASEKGKQMRMNQMTGWGRNDHKSKIDKSKANLGQHKGENPSYFCRCKQDCQTNKCSCKKNGLLCSEKCGHICSNTTIEKEQTSQTQKEGSNKRKLVCIYDSETSGLQKSKKPPPAIKKKCEICNKIRHRKNDLCKSNVPEILKKVLVWKNNSCHWDCHLEVSIN